LDIYLPTLRDKHTYTIMLGMVNLGTVPLDVDPANMGGLGSEAPSVVMKSVDGDALLMKENRHAHRWAILGAALSGAAAGASTSTATVENSDGSTSNVTYHDPNATRAANADARANRDAIDGRTARVASTVLRHNTLGPGEFVVGFVYVERPKGMGKKDGMGQFVVDLGDTIYIFPFEQGRIPR
jgi:hypothetical protein